MLKPFLHRFASTRTGGAEIDGFYSDSDHMWVVHTPNGLRPIIDLADPSAELVTKTMAEQEADDERQMAMLELTTKSDAGQESDDRAPNHAMVLELSTKTHAQLESDDTRSIGNGLL